MASVKLDSVTFTRTLQREVESRILLDFRGEGKPRFLSSEFDAALEEISKKVMTKVKAVVEKESKEHYKESFDEVGGILKQGINVSSVEAEGFDPLETKYRERKKRFNQTHEVFWLFTGKGPSTKYSIIKGYRTFAGARKSSISRTKSTTKIISRGFQRRKRSYKYQIDMAFPVIVQSSFLDNIFRKAYFGAATTFAFRTVKLTAFNDMIVSKTDPMSILAHNEQYRPFITKLMANRGKSLRDLLSEKIKALF